MNYHKSLASIGLRAGIDIRYIHSDLAAFLKDRHGTRSRFSATCPRTYNHYQQLNRDGRFASITVEAVPHRRALASGLDKEVVIAQSREWEERLGLRMNWLIMTNRHLGRSYSLGRFHHPHPRSAVAVTALAPLRGATAGVTAAEAFHALRELR